MEDSVVYLARCMPRMCCTNDLFEWSHELVLDYMCDTHLRKYENHVQLAPEVNESTLAVMYSEGRDLRHRFPMIDATLTQLYSFDPIRPKSIYAIVFVRLDNGEIA